MNRESHSTIDDRQLIQAGYRFALSLTHHAEEAEDLVQHACLKAIRSRGSLVSKSYLFVAIRHLFYDSCEKVKPHPLGESSADSIVDFRSTSESDVDRKLDLARLLGCLRPEEREALYLHCVEGYTAAEIAELTARPRGTVLSLISRAKKRIEERHREKSTEVSQ